MEKKDVPQDPGILGHVRVLCYATDENGEYVKSQSTGWEPTNIANGIVWEFIHEELARIREKVKKGELSPLAYHMNRSLMDAKVLSQYTGIASWRVKRHIKARPFSSLNDSVLGKYASALNMTIDQLKEVP